MQATAQCTALRGLYNLHHSRGSTSYGMMAGMRKLPQWCPDVAVTGDVSQRWPTWSSGMLMKGKLASSSSSSGAGDSASTRASSAPLAAPKIA